MPDLIGQDIGRYRIIEQLGQGGMAVVYKAYDSRLERDVAIKIIRKGQFGTDFQGHLLKRFEREARSLAKMMHPNIVPIYDYGDFDGSPYLVMAYIPGGTLNRHTGKAIAYPQAARWLAPVAHALEYAHSMNVIHRDVKPANILITAKGDPVLSDFGVAKILEGEEGNTLTGIGGGVGTPEYMAPEQWENKVSPQVDIYALGVVFYELLTGHKPFTADTPAAVLRMQLIEPLPRPRSFVPDLPEAVEQVLYKALSKTPEDRYHSMTEFAAALDGFAAGADTLQAHIPVPGSLINTAQPSDEHTAGKTRDDLDTLKSIPSSRPGRFPARDVTLGALALLALILLVVFYKPSNPQSLPATSLPQPTPQTPSASNQGLGGSTQISPKDGMTLDFVPAGTFKMGSDKGDNNAQPVHSVNLNAFWIDQTEVTNGMYAKCVSAAVCQPPQKTQSATHTDYYGNSQYSDYPVIFVNWSQASAYCQWAGRSLPTEAQWEKAAKGTDGRNFPWGDGIDRSKANHNGIVGDTAKVGTYPAGVSPYGVLDMAGNVSEWVADWYDEKYYLSQSTWNNPTGPTSGTARVGRGGSWMNHDEDIRSAVRVGRDPTYTNGDLGFRCAANLAP